MTAMSSRSAHRSISMTGRQIYRRQLHQLACDGCAQGRIAGGGSPTSNPRTASDALATAAPLRRQPASYGFRPSICASPRTACRPGVVVEPTGSKPRSCWARQRRHRRGVRDRIAARRRPSRSFRTCHRASLRRRPASRPGYFGMTAWRAPPKNGGSRRAAARLEVHVQGVAIGAQARDAKPRQIAPMLEQAGLDAASARRRARNTG